MPAKFINVKIKAEKQKNLKQAFLNKLRKMFKSKNTANELAKGKPVEKKIALLENEKEKCDLFWQGAAELKNGEISYSKDDLAIENLQKLLGIDVNKNNCYFKVKAQKERNPIKAGGQLLNFLKESKEEFVILTVSVRPSKAGMINIKVAVYKDDDPNPIIITFKTGTKNAQLAKEISKKTKIENSKNYILTIGKTKNEINAIKNTLDYFKKDRESSITNVITRAAEIQNNPTDTGALKIFLYKEN